MYQDYFGLREMPFSLTPDTQFFFDSAAHRAVLNTVLLALRHSEGFIKIVGEVGTGKTLLCRKLLASLGPEFLTAYIPNPYLTPDELKGFLAQEIGVSSAPDMPAYQLLNEIYGRLVALAAEKRRVVLVVDEAQAMPRETIEALRLLTNLETEKSKLLQVVLLGQPELEEVLNRSDLRQLKQRIVFSETLGTIDRRTLPDYLDFRLQSAGYRGRSLFTRGAVRLMHRASGGIPRLINVLAHKALLVSYGQGRSMVGRAQVARAVQDTTESRRLGRWLSATPFTWTPWLAVSLLLVGFGVGLWWYGVAP